MFKVLVVLVALSAVNALNLNQLNLGQKSNRLSLLSQTVNKNEIPGNQQSFIPIARKTAGQMLQKSMSQNIQKTIQHPVQQKEVTREQLEVMLKTFPNIVDLIPGFNEKFSSILSPVATTTTPTTTTTTPSPFMSRFPTSQSVFHHQPQMNHQQLQQQMIQKQQLLQQKMQQQIQEQKQKNIEQNQFNQQVRQPIEMHRETIRQQPIQHQEIRQQFTEQIRQQPIHQVQQQFTEQIRQPIQQQNSLRLSDICSNSQPGDLIAHPTDMNQFIICYGMGEFTIMSCPIHLFYNPHIKRCDNTIAAPVGCASSPCLNNGKCVDDSTTFNGFRCECPIGFTGENCQRLDSCAQQPCGNNATCVPLAEGSPMEHICYCNGGRVLSQSCTSNANNEMNPCMEPTANLKIFPSKLNPSVFIHCEGMRPHMKFCQAPLVFLPETNSCGWNF